MGTDGKEQIIKKGAAYLNAYMAAIVNLMAVPLIQGVLRAAYRIEMEGKGEKEIGYGTVFAAAVLPMVAACNDADAATIEANLTPTKTSTDFAAVKAAFENNYECLNISCEQVSGLVDDNGGFLMGAEPCGIVAAPAPTAEVPAAAPADEPAAAVPAAADSGASMAGVVGSAVFASIATAMLF